MTALREGTVRPEATTRPDHEDPTLRGRRYAIPYQRVWIEAMDLVNSRSPRWNLLEADDQNGRLRAEAAWILLSLVDEVEIRIRLDPDAQTQVDMTSRCQSASRDLGVNARRVRSFLAALDDRLQVHPNEMIRSGSA